MNPRLLVGDIIAEGLRALRSALSADERAQRVKFLLHQVELHLKTRCIATHMSFLVDNVRRIRIARALAVEPKVIICDEPTSALDVSVQAQIIIQLLKNLQQAHGTSYLFITHNLGVVADIADEVAVMYQGEVVEMGHVKQVLTHPVHPYTHKLIAATPRF
jgi:ABC-type microcin C transport system duplicated ATPase subunit YejF